MKVLITGGAGFIGSHLVDALLQQGDEVWVLDDLSTGSLDNVAAHRENPKFHLVVDTIGHEAVVNELAMKCDRIYHLAAVVGVQLVMQEPVRTIETNVRGTEILLRYANQHRKRVLITSSSEVYGSHEGGTLSEDAQRVVGSTQLRRWAYSCTKALDEFLALAYFEERKLPVVIARLFNTVGPRQTGRYGMVVPRFVKQALLGRPITVYGTGEQRRCFCHVKDTVRALMAMMASEEATGEIFNVGNPEETAIRDLAERVRKLTDSASPIERIPYEEAYGPGFEDMLSRRPDVKKLKTVLGIEPKHDLDRILRDVIEFEERHG